jgi:hypothetical protein
MREHTCRECGDPAPVEADDVGEGYPAYYCEPCARELGIEYDFGQWVEEHLAHGVDMSRRRRRCTGGRMCYCAPFEDEAPNA